MRTLRIALCVLPCLALGCRVDPNQVLLEQESRILEDKLYQLEAMLDDCHAAREATIRENEALKRELAGGDRGPGADDSGPSIPLPGGDREPPRRSRKNEAPKLEAPTIEMPEPSDTPPVEITPGSGDSTVLDGVPTQLVINKRLTGGLDRDGFDGHEGIMVAVEPRDAQGQLVNGPCAVSIVAMDPALEGAAARVARWDFEAHESPSHFRNTAFGRGLQFELPWPSEPPKNRDLRLFVRFTTPEGKKITVDTPIAIRPPTGRPSADREVKNDVPGDAKNWSASENRPARKRVPTSRVKSRSSAPASSARKPSEKDAASDDASPESDNRREPVEQASRAGAPVWKPYR